MDLWVAIHEQNAERLVTVLKKFGFNVPELPENLFMKANQIVRMGVPPMRIELLTTISGVSFEECYRERIIDEIDGVEVSIINLRYLRINKRASGRHKDLDDLEHLS